MITVINNPLGHKLSDNLLSGEATDSAGDVLITTLVSHGLSDGDFIYVESNVKTYNGFRYVDSVSYNTFKLKESENGDYIPYKRDASIQYMVSVLQHGVQCVHLPIVYELESDIYPNNVSEEGYTPASVASFSDNNGRVQLNISEALSDPTRYAKIELVGSGSLAGVYQIIQVLQPWSVVIDLDYDSSYSFSGYVVVKYYDNYAINVNIYAGLSPGHRWEDEKPIELLGTLRLVPDENNRVLFSISEYLRSQIKTVNELDIDTFPNNIHFMTEFYIGYYESYDQSDGDEITTFTDTEFIDTFVGQAINAKNEFKNLYSGHLSDYVSEEDHPAQWMTDFDSPVAVVGYFFDVSFYNHYNGTDVIIDIFKRAGEAVTQVTETIENPGRGIIRVEFTPETGFDEYCVQARTNGQAGSSSAMTIPALSTWLSHAGSGEAWTTGGVPTVSIPVVFLGGSSEYLYAPFPFQDGFEYEIEFDYTTERTSPGVTNNPQNGRIAIMDSSFNILFFNSTTAAVAGPGIPSAQTATISFTANSNCVYIGFRYSTGNDIDITADGVSGTETQPDIPSQTLTEQLCVQIIEECDSTLVGDLRELESGDYRLLE